MDDETETDREGRKFKGIKLNLLEGEKSTKDLKDKRNYLQFLLFNSPKKKKKSFVQFFFPRAKLSD